MAEIDSSSGKEQLYGLTDKQLTRISKAIGKVETMPALPNNRYPTPDAPKTGALTGQLLGSPTNDGTFHAGAFWPYYAKQPHLTEGDGSQPDQHEGTLECWDYSLPIGYRTGGGFVVCNWIGGRWIVNPYSCPEKTGTPPPTEGE